MAFWGSGTAPDPSLAPPAASGGEAVGRGLPGWHVVAPATFSLPGETSPSPRPIRPPPLEGRALMPAPAW